MRTTLKGILIGAVLLIVTGQAFAYPPDNAAVLYYRAFVLLEEPNDDISKMLAAVRKGEAKPNDQIRQYIERNRRIIKYVMSAAEIGHCDWGLDFLEGMDLSLPHLHKSRMLAHLLAADVRILAEQGDNKTALERCVAMHEMARHIGNDMLIQRLVGIAVSGYANGCIIDILPQVSDDSETLQWLKVRLASVSSRFPSMRAAIARESEIMGQNINREDLLSHIEGEPCGVPKEILQGDDEFFARAREYWYSVMARMQSAFDLSYLQAYQELNDLGREVENFAMESPEAVVTSFLFPAIGRCCTIEARGKTQLNAVLAGIDIYLIRAKTGKLPDELPAGLPKDMFSGKDFLYEKTDAGFVLKCQGKEIDKDVVQQYEFKVAK